MDLTNFAFDISISDRMAKKFDGLYSAELTDMNVTVATSTAVVFGYAHDHIEAMLAVKLDINYDVKSARYNKHHNVVEVVIEFDTTDSAITFVMMQFQITAEQARLDLEDYAGDLSAN